MRTAHALSPSGQEHKREVHGDVIVELESVESARPTISFVHIMCGLPRALDIIETEGA